MFDLAMKAIALALATEAVFLIWILTGFISSLTLKNIAEKEVALKRQAVADAELQVAEATKNLQDAQTDFFKEVAKNNKEATQRIASSLLTAHLAAGRA